MHTETVTYREGGLDLEGFLAYDEGLAGKRPIVLIAHAWAGQGELERDKAKRLAELGYAGFALDMYGVGRRGTSPEENALLMQPLVQDRGLLARRIRAGYEAARSLPVADPKRMGAIGFCFGGLCALDLAREGAELCGVVSFHGLLAGREGLETQRIGAKLLVLHGHDDPLVPREQIDAFTAELDAAGADWQMHHYGHTVHAFTNPNANDPAHGMVFEPKAERRSWIAMRSFFEEAFA
jgi:dienelactone hydrolase